MLLIGVALKKPSFLIISLTIMVYKIFQKLLTRHFEENFMKCKYPITLRYLNLFKDINQIFHYYGYGKKYLNYNW
uniref:Venom toxin-like peptide-7 n=1 Tax=Mesobuthus eupeus TaxID=34648 RepID=E4VP52_MESEU|nr:venom toxin-like peptide-7 [Mesobuthus eupeus]